MKRLFAWVISTASSLTVAERFAVGISVLSLPLSVASFGYNIYRDFIRDEEQIRLSFRSRIAYETQIDYYIGLGGKDKTGPVFLELQWEGIFSNTGAVAATITSCAFLYSGGGVGSVQIGPSQSHLTMLTDREGKRLLPLVLGPGEAQAAILYGRVELPAEIYDQIKDEFPAETTFDFERFLLREMGVRDDRLGAVPTLKMPYATGQLSCRTGRDTTLIADFSYI